MTGRQKLITALAAAHITLVAWHSLLLPLPPWGNPAGDALRWYGAVSGANNSYGFFKQVGSSIKVSFTILDDEGNVIADKLHQAENREVELRINSGANLLDEHHTEALLQNWAAAMFGRHPDAALIRVSIETFDPGTMEEWRAGKRPEWIDRTRDTPKVYVRVQPEGD
jgi:hypothetical protein